MKKVNRTVWRSSESDLELLCMEGNHAIITGYRFEPRDLMQLGLAIDECIKLLTERAAASPESGGAACS